MEKKANIFEFGDFLRVIPKGDILNYRDTVAMLLLDGKKAFGSSEHALPVRVNAVSLMIIDEGTVTITIDYQRFTAGKNSAFLLLDRHLINGIDNSDDIRGRHIFVDNDFFRESTGAIRPPMPGEVKSDIFPTLYNFDEKNFAELTADAAKLERDIRRKEHFYQKGLIHADIASIVYELWNYTAENIDPLKNYNGRKEEITYKFFNLVFAHSASEREVGFYASELCISPEYLSRTVKAKTGQTPQQIIGDVLLADAKRMLRSGEKSVTDAAYELNFSDAAAFSKFFKKKTGISPREFQKI